MIGNASSGVCVGVVGRSTRGGTKAGRARRFRRAIVHGRIIAGQTSVYGSLQWNRTFEIFDFQRSAGSLEIRRNRAIRISLFPFVDTQRRHFANSRMTLSNVFRIARVSFEPRILVLQHLLIHSLLVRYRHLQIVSRFATLFNMVHAILFRSFVAPAMTLALVTIFRSNRTIFTLAILAATRRTRAQRFLSRSSTWTRFYALVIGRGQTRASWLRNYRTTTRSSSDRFSRWVPPVHELVLAVPTEDPWGPHRRSPHQSYLKIREGKKRNENICEN